MNSHWISAVAVAPGKRFALLGLLLYDYGLPRRSRVSSLGKPDFYFSQPHLYAGDLAPHLYTIRPGSLICGKIICYVIIPLLTSGCCHMKFHLNIPLFITFTARSVCKSQQPKRHLLFLLWTPLFCTVHLILAIQLPFSLISGLSPWLCLNGNFQLWPGQKLLISQVCQLTMRHFL